MAANALFITTMVLMGLGLVLLQVCQFLAPYRALVVGRYGWVIVGFLTALFFNVFSAIYWVSRRLFLKDTGRKLAHLERQLRTGDAMSDDFTERLRD